MGLVPPSPEYRGQQASELPKTPGFRNTDGGSGLPGAQEYAR